MLSNRDTEFSEDGWALALDDLRRHDLLLSQGSNDLNAGAVAANQTTTDLSDGLAAHVAASNPHPQYQLLSDVAASTSYVTTGAGTETVGVNDPGSYLSSSITNATGTGGMAIASGIFTAPGDGLYHVSTSIIWGYTPGAPAFATIFGTSLYQIVAGGIAVALERHTFPVYNGVGINDAASLAASVFLFSGQTIRLAVQFTDASGGAPASGTAGITWLSIVRLTNS